MKLSELKDYLPLTGTILLLITILRQNVYYSAYGINFLNYLDFSNAITLFLSDLVKVLFILLFATYFFIYFYTFAPKNRRIRYIIFNIILLVFTYIIAIDYCNVFHHFYDSTIRSNITGILSALFSAFLLRISLFTFIKYKDENDKTSQSKFFFCIFSLICLTVYCIEVDGLSQKFNEVAHQDLRNSTTIVLNDSTNIKTNKDTILLGSTNSNWFIYIISKKQSVILNNNNVKEITEIKKLSKFLNN